MIKDICKTDVIPDGLVFDSKSVKGQRIKEDADYEGDNTSDRQTLWKAFLNKGEIQHAPQELSAVAKEIEQFLIKPLDAIKKDQKFRRKWKAPGPWKL